MKNIDLSLLDERDYDNIELLSQELRSTIEETVLGLILKAIRGYMSHPNDINEFQAKVLQQIVDQFDRERYAPMPKTTQVTLNEAMVDTAIGYAESRGEKIASYIARLVEQDMEQAKEPPLAETG